MNIFQAIILGVVQGITEFLPVSSSGHLNVLQHLFHIEEIPPLFDIILHIPSLLVVIIFFRKKIARLFAILFRWILRKPAPQKNAVAEKASQSDDADILDKTDELGRQTIIAVIVTTFVTGAIGIFTSKLLPDLPIKAVCTGFLFTSALLIASGMISRRRAESGNAAASKGGITIFQALVIGFMQGVGTLPGVSRSGSTIAGSLFCGVDRTAAGEYSFIVSIPAILAAFVLELKDASKMAAVGFAPIALACVACFVAAYASLAWLMKIVKKGRLAWFACYLIPLGILGLIFF